MRNSAGLNMLARSHERQWSGEDYQAVAQDLCDELPNATEEDYHYLSGSPDPACDCKFCKSNPWKDSPWES